MVFPPLVNLVLCQFLLFIISPAVKTKEVGGGEFSLTLTLLTTTNGEQANKKYIENKST